MTKNQIDELLRFLPMFDPPQSDTAPTWVNDQLADGTRCFPYPDYPPVVVDFFTQAGQDCWTDANYNVAEDGDRLRDDAAVASATLLQIKSMLTVCVRGERFCDGHWADVVKTGRVGAILRRLNELREEATDE